MASPKVGMPADIGGGFPEIVGCREARMRRPAGDEFAIGWLLEWRATGALPPGRQGARTCSAHERGPGFVFTTIADGNLWRVASVARRARRKRLRLRDAPTYEIASTRRARRRGPIARLAARIHIAGNEHRLTLRRILLIGQPVEVHRRVFFRYCKRLSVVTRMSRANIRMFRETTYLSDTARRNQIPALPCFNPKMKSASTDAPLGNCSTPTDVRV